MADRTPDTHITEDTNEPWCNCQAIPGTVNYPGPWHPQYDPISCKTTRVAGVSVGYAATTGAPGGNSPFSEPMSEDDAAQFEQQLMPNAPVHADPRVSGVTEDMVERAASELYGGPHHRAKVVDGEVVEYTVTWDENEDDGHFGRDFYRRQARRVLSAALTGCTPVVLPEPDAVDHRGNPIWNLTPAGNDVTVCVDGGQPFVSALSPCDPADLAERYALALLAGVHAARRLAAGSQVGDHL